MPGPGGHHGGHHGGPGGGHHGPPMGGGMHHHPPMGRRPYRHGTGCCGCMLPVMGIALTAVGLLLCLFL